MKKLKYKIGTQIVFTPLKRNFVFYRSDQLSLIGKIGTVNQVSSLLCITVSKKEIFVTEEDICRESTFLLKKALGLNEI